MSILFICIFIHLKIGREILFAKTALIFALMSCILIPLQSADSAENWQIVKENTAKQTALKFYGHFAPISIRPLASGRFAPRRFAPMVS